MRVGLTSQLTASLSNGGPTTSVTWQSDSPGIATVSPDGVLTAVSVGGTRVTATAGGVTASVSVVVQPTVTTTVTLTSCGSITAPGHYVVGAELRGTPCLSVSSVADVQIDCASHTLGPLILNNVNTAAVSNCSVIGDLQLTNTTNVTVTNSSVFGGILWAINSTNVAFISNNVTIQQTGIGGAVVLTGGSHNRVINNTLIGGYGGGLAQTGTDDGIILGNESGDLVQGNTINDFFDAGVEGVDAVSNTTIADNTMTNLGTVGVSSYWCTEWTGNLIQRNSVSTAPRLVWLEYETSQAKCGSTPGLPILHDNQFVGNSIRNPVFGTFGPLAQLRGMLVDFAGDVANNLVQNNDFGPFTCPLINPSGGFVDGGGNLCAAPAGASNVTALGKVPALWTALHPAVSASRPRRR